jgi:type I restriction enzyme S subunit
MPNNWKTYKLSETLKIVGGGTPKTSVPEYWDGDIPWLSVKDFQGEKKFVSETEKSITQLGLAKSSTKLLPKDAMIISARGTVGELAVLEREMAFNQSCYGLLPKEKTDRDFLYYLVKQKIKELQGLSYGSVFDTITTKTFDGLDVQMPDLPEQKAIASILSAIDDKIENNLAINKTLKDMAMALYKHWFVDFGPFQDGEFIDSELGLIPKGWEVKRLNDLADILNSKRVPLSTRERSTRKGKYPYYGASGIIDYIDDYIFDGEYVIISEDGENLRSRKTPIAFSAVGKFWVNNHAHILQGKNRGVNKLLISHIAQLEMNPFLTGAVQPKLNKQNLLSIGIPFPKDDSVIRELLDKFYSFSKKEISIELENQNLIKLRDTLLPKLISGEVRLKEFQNQIETVL